jgi:hypothetical protein
VNKKRADKFRQAKIGRAGTKQNRMRAWLAYKQSAENGHKWATMRMVIQVKYYMT